MIPRSSGRDNKWSRPGVPPFTHVFRQAKSGQVGSLRLAGFVRYASPARMATSCPKCGGTKTESVGAGLLYWLASAFGYRLRMCGRCRSYRFFRRSGESRGARSPEPPAEQSQPVAAAAADDPQPAPAASESSPSEEQSPERTHSCPHCGGKDYRRSRRRWLERRKGSPPMLRCRNCNHRFPLPGY